MSNPTKLQEYLDTLAMFPDRQDRIETLIGFADEYKHPTREAFPRDENSKVPGCESEVYVRMTKTEDRYNFGYAVDNPQGISAMAMAAILSAGLENCTAQEINAIDDQIVFEIFGKELSMGKNLGLTNMLRVSKHLANLS